MLFILFELYHDISAGNKVFPKSYIAHKLIIYENHTNFIIKHMDAYNVHIY